MLYSRFFLFSGDAALLEPVCLSSPPDCVFYFYNHTLVVHTTSLCDEVQEVVVGSGEVPLNGVMNFTRLSAGQHHIRLLAQDAAGLLQQAHASFSWTVIPTDSVEVNITSGPPPFFGRTETTLRLFAHRGGERLMHPQLEVKLGDSTWTRGVVVCNRSTGDCAYTLSSMQVAE